MSDILHLGKEQTPDMQSASFVTSQRADAAYVDFQALVTETLER